MFLFYHLGKRVLPPKNILSKNSALFKNRRGMVGEVVLSLINNINNLGFTTLFIGPLIFNGIFQTVLPPFRGRL